MQNIINGQHLQYNHTGDAGYDLLMQIEETSSNSIGVKNYLKNNYSANLNWHTMSGKYLPKLYLNGKFLGEYKNKADLNKFIEVAETHKLFVILPPARISHDELYFGLANFSNCELIRTAFDFVEPSNLMDAVRSHVKPDFDPIYNIAGFIYPRSGLGAKHQITIANNVGVVDIGYRNNVSVALENRGRDIHMFTNGSRIAQLVLGVILNNGYNLEPLEGTESVRGLAGFGSTGVK